MFEIINRQTFWFNEPKGLPIDYFKHIYIYIRYI